MINAEPADHDDASLNQPTFKYSAPEESTQYNYIQFCMFTVISTKVLCEPHYGYM